MVRYRLRSELRLELREDRRAGELLDDLLTRRVGLGVVGVALATRLDGSRAIGDVIDELVTEGMPRDRVEASVRSLLLLHLVDGIGDDVRARLTALRHGKVELDYQALPDAQFACQSSSACCRSYKLGPVQPEERARILSLPLRDAMPDLPSGDLFVESTIDGQTQIYLRSVGARCVFLRPNLYCGIHAHFGERLKPDTCRFYPLEVQVTFEGARVYDKVQCASHFVSQSEGPQIIATARLLRPSFESPALLSHPIVFLREDTPIDFSHYLVLERELRAIVGQGSPIAALQRTVAFYDSFVAMARCFAIEQDPADAVAAWRASLPTTAAPAAAPNWELLIELFEQLAYEVTDYLSDAHARQGDNRDMAPLASQLLPIVNYLYHRTVDRAGKSGASLDADVEVAPPSDDDDFVRALQRSLTAHFYGRVALPDDRPFLAIGQAAIALLCAFVGAQRTAAAENRPYRVADLSNGHMLAMRPLLTFSTTHFKNNPERVRSLVAALPLLLNWQPAVGSGRVDA